MTVAFISDTFQTMKLNERDLKIEWFSGSGAGGQHRNKHQNCIRLLHVPTGIKVIGATERSRAANQKNAMDELDRRLNEMLLSSHTKDVAAVRKSQVGSGMRGDKIRTYRFQDDVVTDHVTGKTASVKQVMKGNFELLWSKND